MQLATQHSHAKTFTPSVGHYWLTHYTRVHTSNSSHSHRQWITTDLHSALGSTLSAPTLRMVPGHHTCPRWFGSPNLDSGYTRHRSIPTLPQGLPLEVPSTLCLHGRPSMACSRGLCRTWPPTRSHLATQPSIRIYSAVRQWKVGMHSTLSLRHV